MTANTSSSRKRFDCKLRLQAYKDTLYGMLLEYLTNLGSREANELIFRRLWMTLSPWAYQERGELSPEQLRLKALEAAKALEEYAFFIRESFGTYREQMVALRVPDANPSVNGEGQQQEASVSDLSHESDKPDKPDESDKLDELDESDKPDESDESDEFNSEGLLLFRGAKAATECDEVFGDLD